MAYTATSWVNGSEPAINAANLNKLEAGVVAAHEADKGDPGETGPKGDKGDPGADLTAELAALEARVAALETPAE